MVVICRKTSDISSPATLSYPEEYRRSVLLTFRNCTAYRTLPENNSPKSFGCIIVIFVQTAKRIRYVGPQAHRCEDRGAVVSDGEVEGSLGY